MRVPLWCVIVWTGCDEQPADDTSPLDTDPANVDDTDPVTNDVLAIAGSYTDEWGVDHTIDEQSWNQESEFFSATFHVLSFDNAGMWVIAQNDPSDAYFPGLYSRFDWVEGLHGDLFYCQTEIDAATAEAAEATPRADDTDPDNAGCVGFPWTNLVP
jgi:hypothetical protein